MSIDDAELDQLRSRRWQLFGVAALALVVIAGLAIAFGGFGGGGDKGTRSPNGIRGAKETGQLLRGIPQQGIVLGRPTAPATITVFADLHCPICRGHFTGDELRELVDKAVRPGKANVELRLVDLLGANSGLGRVAVDRLAASGSAWNLALMLYFNQGAEGGSWIDDRLLQRIAAVTPSLEAAPLSLREDATSRRVVAETDALRQRLGVDGTPTYFVRRRGSADYREIGNTFLGGPTGRILDAVDELQP